MAEEEISRNYVAAAHPTAFSAPGNIKRHYNNQFGNKTILKTLSTVDSYTLHREYKRPKYRNPYFIYSIREQIQMDLIDMSRLAADNDGVTFLLVAIDSFSKKAWIKNMTNKSAMTSLAVIKEIVNEVVPPIKTIFFDRGTEFKNQFVRAFLTEKNIKIIHPSSETKAAIAERFNRTIQDLIYRFLTENETNRYIDVLPQLLQTYNNRGHRTLKYLTPNEAEKPENKTKVLDALNFYYSQITSHRQRPKYVIGEIVRIKVLADKMRRGYQTRFNEEHFKIIGINTRLPIPMYFLKSLDTNEDIKGGFYANEMQPITGDIFKIDYVIKRKTIRGQNKVFVKWKGFNDSHNSWINASDITRAY
jgi:Integrase core domain/Chromo (CHRromatin Organisation MOdifier) domain